MNRTPIGFLLLGALVVAAFGAASVLPGESVPSEEGSPPSIADVSPPPGAEATWVPDPNAPVSSSSNEVTALVERVGCSGGTTGKVLAPGIRRTRDEVVITFTVERLPPGFYTCPGNDQVPYRVDLGEPLGRRKLVDGLCLRSGPLVETSYCENDEGVRWRP